MGRNRASHLFLVGISAPPPLSTQQIAQFKNKIRVGSDSYEFSDGTRPEFCSPGSFSSFENIWSEELSLLKGSSDSRFNPQLKHSIPNSTFKFPASLSSEKEDDGGVLIDAFWFLSLSLDRCICLFSLRHLALLAKFGPHPYPVCFCVVLVPPTGFMAAPIHFAFRSRALEFGLDIFSPSVATNRSIFGISGPERWSGLPLQIRPRFDAMFYCF